MFPSMNRTSPRRWWIIAGAVAVAGVALLSFSSAIPGNIDDAFIVLVYARHLLEGGGLYWNRLDGPVEGFTSPLDLMVKALATWIAPDDPVQAVFWSSLALHVASALALLFVVVAFGPRDRRRTWGIALLAGLCVASNHTVAFGASFLLEAPLFSLAVLVLLAIRFTQEGAMSSRRAVALGVAALAVGLTRPEGLVLMAIVMAFVVAMEADSAARRRTLVSFGGVLCLVMVLFLWRRLYFGAWLPNTYYAKASSVLWNEIVDGARYLKEGAGNIPGGLLLAVAVGGWGVAVVRRWRDRASRWNYTLLALLALASTATVVLGGGDSYPGGRFLALPYTLAIAMLGTAALGLRGRVKAVPVAALVLVLGTNVLTLTLRASVIRTQVELWPLSERDFTCEAVGFHRLAGIVGDLPVAESDAQRLKYFEDRVRVIDLHGLSDPDMARQETPEPVRWGRYTPRRGVEVDAAVWISGYRWMAREPMAEQLMEHLVADPALFPGYLPIRKDVSRRIIDRYAPASIPACPGRFLNVLVRRDRAPAFRAAGALVGR